MEETRPLSGACSCGRNHYLISIPSNHIQSLKILFDDRAEHSSALSLRVPLTTIRSTTYAFYPDETHSAIRRVFTPSHAPHTKRHFCGFCGTPLTYWSEGNPEEAEWVCVNMASLKSESVERLEDAGLLSDVKSDDQQPLQDAARSALQTTASNQVREIRGNPWFEQMIEGSELGRIKRQRGGGSSVDGETRVEWEIVEFNDEQGEAGVAATGKRKLGALGHDDDVEMRSG